MNRFQLYRLLRHNIKLSTRRSPMLEQSNVAKVMMFLGGGMFIIYLIFYGTLMGMAVERGEYATLIVFMPFILVVDFFLRFMVQQTPLMMVKPYILLPISKYATIETFLISSLGSTYNWLWLCLSIPYAIIALASGCSFVGVLMTVVTVQLLVLLNSQIYLMIRTLIGRSLLWWFLAIAIYALPFLPWIFNPTEKGFDNTAELWVAAGTGPWLFILTLALLVLMLCINRRMQFAYVYEEISRQKKTTLKRVSQFRFLEHFGQMGEYLKLEIKSVIRNKSMRSRFWMSLGLIVMFSLLVAYTNVYDGTTMTAFLCFYCFAIYGVTSLTKVMGCEGNYIDLLMTHRENILKLLMAKYLFHCAIVIVPLLIMLPAVIEGKYTLLMVVAYLLLTTGLVYFIMFQLAVYNKQTLPLEQKLTGKGNFENGIQFAIEMAALIIPLILVAALRFTLGETMGYTVQAIFGLLLTLTAPLWMRNIYQRMMKRKYQNLDGFYASR